MMGRKCSSVIFIGLIYWQINWKLGIPLINCLCREFSWDSKLLDLINACDVGCRNPFLRLDTVLNGILTDKGTTLFIRSAIVSLMKQTNSQIHNILFYIKCNLFFQKISWVNNIQQVDLPHTCTFRAWEDISSDI